MMDSFVKELYDDAWNQIRFAQRKIDEARRTLRYAGTPLDDPSLTLTAEALSKLTEANRAVVKLELEIDKKEEAKK